MIIPMRCAPPCRSCPSSGHGACVGSGHSATQPGEDSLAGAHRYETVAKRNQGRHQAPALTLGCESRFAQNALERIEIASIIRFPAGDGTEDDQLRNPVLTQSAGNRFNLFQNIAQRRYNFFAVHFSLRRTESSVITQPPFVSTIWAYVIETSRISSYCFRSTAVTRSAGCAMKAAGCGQFWARNGWE